MSTLRTTKKFYSSGTTADGYDVFATQNDAVDTIVAAHPNELADSIRELQRSLLDGYASTKLLANASTYGGPSFQDGQTIIYQSSTSSFVAGASGDSSFKLQSMSATGTLSVKGGELILDDGKELATYDGAGTATSDFSVDISFDVDLTTLIEGGSAASATTYYVYVDLTTLPAATTLTAGASQGRKLYGITSANFVLSSTAPEALGNARRYVPLGFIRNASGANSWSTTVIDTLAVRRHSRTAINASPMVYSTTGITSATHPLGTIITHNANVLPADQQWSGTVVTAADGYTSELDDSWMINKTQNALEVDFSFLASGDTVSLKLENLGLSATSVPTKTYDSGYIAANTVAASITHGLGMIPTAITLQHAIAAGEYENLDPASYLSATATVLNTSMGPLGTDLVRIVASSGVEAVAVTDFIAQIVTTNINAVAKSDLLVDASAIRTITLPAGPVLGDIVRITDATAQAGTNNITVARNGSNIDGVGADFVINVNSAWVEFIYMNSTRGWVTRV